MSSKLVPLRSANDEMIRYVCRLPRPAFETWRDFTLMIEELEGKEGKPAPGRGRARGTDPAPSSMNHVLAHAIMNTLGKDANLNKWRAARAAKQSSAAAAGQTDATDTRR